MNHLYKKIETIKTRPGMFLGTISVSKLRSFLDGYKMALYDFKLSERTALLPLPFWFFHEYVAERFGYYESTSGWCNMILDQVARDEEKGFHLFYTLFEEFKQTTISRCFVADLNESNIKFHLSDKSVPYCLSGENFDIREPLYKNPVRVYYAELSNLPYFKGYVGITQTHEQFDLESEVYKNEKDALAHFEGCFGAVEWQEIKLENLEFILPEITQIVNNK